MSDIYSADGTGAEGSGPTTGASPGGDARRPTEVAKERLNQAGQALKGEAQSFAQGAKTQATDKAEAAKTQVGSTIHTFADAIRKAGDDLGEHDQTFAARLVREAADGLEGFSRALSEKRPEEMLDTVRDFGRRNPAAFVAGSVLVGLAVGRFFRASERNLEPEYGSPLQDSEVAEGNSLIAAPEALEPMDVDLGDEEPTSLSAAAPDVLGDDIVDQQTAAEQSTSPAALAEGGDLDPGRSNESIEGTQGAGPGRTGGSDIERGI
jgi:hypothetical protein